MAHKRETATHRLRSPLHRLAPADILIGQTIDQPMGQIDGKGRLVRLPLALLFFGDGVLELGLDVGQLVLQIVNFGLEILQSFACLEQLLMRILQGLLLGPHNEEDLMIAMQIDDPCAQASSCHGLLHNFVGIEFGILKIQNVGYL